VTEAESGNRYQVPASLIRVFDAPNAADQFVDDAGDALGMTATSLVHALRVRSEPRLDSQVVYRLRAGEEVQLVTSTDTITTINGRSGVWYELIAGGQHRGYAFGPLLEGTPSDEVRLASRGDESAAPLTVFTEAIGGDVWISSTTKERFATGGRDLSAMRLTDNAVVIRMNDEERRAALESVVIDGTVADFEDGGVRMALSSEDEIRVTIQDEDTSQHMVFFPQDEARWSELWSEYRRRNDVATLLAESAGLYRSATYGTVRLLDDGSLQWSDKQALIPRIFRTEEIQNFSIGYLPRISSDLQNMYDGAIMLETPSAGRSPVFLVDVLPDALRVVWVPGFDSEEPMVNSSPVNPLIMYFSASEDPPIEEDGS